MNSIWSKGKMEMLGRTKSSIAYFGRHYKVPSVGALLVLLFLLMGIFAPWIAPRDPIRVSPRDSLRPPGGEFLLGTDILGRDLLSRIIHGARVSLLIAFAAVGIGAIVGTVLGMFAGWERKIEMPLMRLMDVLLCFPGIIVALSIVAILGRNVENIILAIALYRIPQFARLAYGLTLSIKENTYIEAAAAIGVPSRRIMTRYILPNILAPIVVQFSLMVPGAIMTVAGLSFLGLGIKPPTPEWGSMLQNSITWSRSAPHVMIFPGVALMLVVLGFNMLGDGLRDFLDPRIRKV